MDRTAGSPTAAWPSGGATAPGLGPAPAARAAVVVLLLVTVVLGSALAGPWDPPMRAAPTSAPSVPPPTTTPEPAPTDPVKATLDAMDIRPWDLGALWIAMALLAGGAVLLLAVRWLRALPRSRPDGPPDPGGVVAGATVEGAVTPALPVLREGVDGAREELRAAVPPADAVIAAWVALERAAAASGIPRHPAATPTEFTVDVLDRTRADRDATRTLLDLYLRARFGHEALDARAVDTASAAVHRLAADLGVDEERPPDDDAADGGSPHGGSPRSGPPHAGPDDDGRRP